MGLVAGHFDLTLAWVWWLPELELPKDFRRASILSMVYRVQVSGSRVQGSSFKVQGSGFRVQGD